MHVAPVKAQKLEEKGCFEKLLLEKCTTAGKFAFILVAFSITIFRNVIFRNLKESLGIVTKPEILAFDLGIDFCFQV